MNATIAEATMKLVDKHNSEKEILRQTAQQTTEAFYALEQEFRHTVNSKLL